MLHIAVCDDEQESINTVVRHIEEYNAKNHEVECVVHTFRNTLDLASKVAQGTHYDIFLLDIYMDDMTGMALAQELRQQGFSTPVVFLTSSPSHALEAFGVGATQYLVKPFTATAFYGALHEAIQRCGLEQKRQIIVKEGRKLVCVNVHDIIYAESCEKVQVITLTDGSTLSPRMTSTALFEMLSPFPGFVRCGAGFILSLAHFRKLDTKVVTLSTGQRISIPRGAQQGIREAYFSFFRLRSM